MKESSGITLPRWHITFRNMSLISVYCLQPKHIADINKRKHYDDEELGQKSEIGLHLAQTIDGRMFTSAMNNSTGFYYLLLTFILEPCSIDFRVSKLIKLMHSTFLWCTTTNKIFKIILKFETIILAICVFIHKFKRLPHLHYLNFYLSTLIPLP